MSVDDTPVVDGSKGCRPPFFFDLETGPDIARVPSFNLPPVPEIPPLQSADTLPPPADILSLPLGLVQQRLRELSPEPYYLSLLEENENDRPKPRAGLMEEIKRYESYRASLVQAESDRLKLLSVTPEYCQIIAASYCFGQGQIQTLITGEDGSESYIVSRLWSEMSEAECCVGYNIIGFDIPVLLVRSWLYELEPLFSLAQATRFGNETVIDIYKKRFPHRGDSGPGKLKEIGPLYGVNPTCPDVDGSHAWTLYREDPEKLRAYAASDVHMARSLYYSWRGYWF